MYTDKTVTEQILT